MSGQSKNFKTLYAIQILRSFNYCRIKPDFSFICKRKGVFKPLRAKNSKKIIKRIFPHSTAGRIDIETPLKNGWLAAVLKGETMTRIIYSYVFFFSEIYFFLKTNEIAKRFFFWQKDFIFKLSEKKFYNFRYTIFLNSISNDFNIKNACFFKKIFDTTKIFVL